MNDVQVTVVLACGCRRPYVNAPPVLDHICDLHGDLYPVVAIEGMPPWTTT